MSQPEIEDYSFGRIVVGGLTYDRDILVTPSGVISPWWRKVGHLLTLEDIKAVEGVEVDSVVIGTGYNGMMKVLEDVGEYFRQNGVEVYIFDTRKAVEVYNDLVRRGKRVLGAFHLTC